MACSKAISTVVCTFEFTNNGNEDYYLLKYDTPLEGPFSEFVTVSFEGCPLEYQGIFAVRIPPTKESFILVKAGRSISASIQISDFFSFTSYGIYSIRYNKPLQYLSSYKMNLHSANGMIPVCRQSVTFDESYAYIYLNNTDSILQPRIDDDVSTAETKYTVNIEACGSATFENFAGLDDAAIIAAHKKMCPNVLKAKNAVGDNELYREWFEPTYTTTRSEKVKDMYQKIYDGLITHGVTYVRGTSSGCSKGAAYTSFGSKRVKICPVLFKYPTFCVNDEMTIEGTLVHEWSHAFGRAKDHAYFPCDNMALAKTDPEKAINNADNYALYYCLTHDDDSTVSLINTNSLLQQKSNKAIFDANAKYDVMMQSCNNAKFVDLSSSEQKTILEVHKKICNNLLKVISSVGDTDLYRKWFEEKAYTSTRGSKVKDTYQKVYNAMIKGTLTYSGSPYCFSFEEIYVSTSKIYTCPSLFTSPTYCLPPGSEDGNTIEGAILYGWVWGAASLTVREYTDIQACNPKRYAKYYPDKAVTNCGNYVFYYCETR